MEATNASAPERVDTVVIGAGQAGLATAYCLAQKGIDFVVVDGCQRIGDAWRNRWDSLRLFTPAYMNNLPGFPFPAPSKRYLASKDEAADYLEQYARRFEFPLRLGRKVERLSRNGEGYAVQCAGRRIEAKNVMVATGPYQRPRVPEFASELAPDIRQLHSSRYRNPEQLAGGDTLVVGAATSGSQIAIELAGSRRVMLSGRNVPCISKSFLGIPTDFVFVFISSRPDTSRIGRKIKARARTAGAPLIGFNYKHVKRSGVERVPRTIGVSDGRPQLEDGRVLDVANIVWSTGFSLDFSWIDLPIFESDGYPRHQRGVVTESPGLYFVGLLFLHTLSSSTLYGVGSDARHLVDHLVSQRRHAPAEAIGEPARSAS